MAQGAAKWGPVHPIAMKPLAKARDALAGGRQARIQEIDLQRGLRGGRGRHHGVSWPWRSRVDARAAPTSRPAMMNRPLRVLPVACSIIPITVGPMKPPTRPQVLTRAMPPASPAPASLEAGNRKTKIG